MLELIEKQGRVGIMWYDKELSGSFSFDLH